MELSEDEKELIEIKDSIRILKDTELDINIIDCVDLRTYNYAIKTVLTLIEKQQKEIKLKDKVIDEMAEHIVNSAVVDDTVCGINLNCNCDEKECDYKEMLNCTKQYFINKEKENKE